MDRDCVVRGGQKDWVGKPEVDRGMEMERGIDRDLDSGRENEMVGRRELSELDQNRILRGGDSSG